MEPDDVAMVQGSHHAGFAFETRQEVGIVLQIGVQELDGGTEKGFSLPQAAVVSTHVLRCALALALDCLLTI